MLATRPTWVTTPGVMLPSGSVMLTRSPSFTSDCSDGSRSIVTIGVIEVAVSTTDPAVAWPPSDVVLPRPVTSAGPGRNAAWPSGSVPVTVRPSLVCSCSTAYAVSAL